MLKRFTIALMMVAGLSFAISSCSEKNPTFVDPDPLDTTGFNFDTLGQDTSDNNNQNPDKDKPKIGIKVFYKSGSGSGGGGNTTTWISNVDIELYNYQGQLLAKRTAKHPQDQNMPDELQSLVNDPGTESWALFRNNSDYLDRGFKYVLEPSDTITDDGKKYYTKDTITVLKNGWDDFELELQEL